MKLYTYARSSAAYRVRIALNLKGIAYEPVPVHLLRDGGEQRSERYRALHPQGLVPALETDDGHVLAQSPAIIEYLDETVPEPPLLPADPVQRARIRAVTDAIACDIHPINNLRVLQYLRGPMGHADDEVQAWYAHWIRAGGLVAVERMLGAGPFAFGDSPTLADVFIMPQLFNARRYDVPIDDLPRLLEVEAACTALEPFRRAHPDNQPDAAG